MTLAYDPIGNTPSGGPTPGARALYEYGLARWGGIDRRGTGIRGLGIYNPRDVCGNPWPNFRCGMSAHGEGRSGDWGVPSLGAPIGREIADWLVLNAANLGVQEVIWDRERWAANTREWRPYEGRSDHRDHVHWTLNKTAAADLTADAIPELVNDIPVFRPPPEVPVRVHYHNALDGTTADVTLADGDLWIVDHRDSGTVWITDSAGNVLACGRADAVAIDAVDGPGYVGLVPHVAGRTITNVRPYGADGFHIDADGVPGYTVPFSAADPSTQRVRALERTIKLAREQAQGVVETLS